MKKIRVTMPDGSRWDVPAEVIAEDRAQYYVENDPDTTFESEYEYTMTDHPELLDWAANNMDWAEVFEHATRIDGPRPVDYQEGWVNGAKEIVEV